MEIGYLGHSAFRIKTKSASVVTDPYGDKAGKFPRDISAEIVLVSHDHFDHNEVKAVAGSPFVINGPGEYEVKGISVIGIPTWHDDSSGSTRGQNTAYVIEVEGLRLLHLGDLGHKLSQEQLEEIGAIDVVMVPVGGVFTIDAKVAAEVVKQVDPAIVIPMHYQQPGLDAATFAQLGDVTEFIKEMGKSEVAAIPKLVLSADRLPTELQVVVLERK